MKTAQQDIPWRFLDTYRGTHFHGSWPTLPELFTITTERFPDRQCYTVYDPERSSMPYSEALAIIGRVANFLRSIKIDHGDKVAVSGKNSPEWAIAYMATLFAGATVVPIDYQLKDAEIDKLLSVSGAKALFIDEERFERFRAGKAAPRGVFSLSRNHDSYIYHLESKRTYKITPARQDDLAAILFTSGTTGTPKGVMLTHANFVSDCFLAQANLGIFHTDVFYALLPLHHSYCMLAVFIESMSVGAELVFGKRMVITQILHDLKEARVTMFLGVPMLFNKVLNGIMRGVRRKGIVVYALVRFLMGVSGLIKKLFRRNPGKKIFRSVLDKASLATVRICICGGGPLAPSVFRRYNQLGIDFVQGYGLTETAPILTLNPVEHYKETSVGRVIPEVDMRIIDPDERGAGEIVVKGPMVMQGYYNLPRETAEVFTEDGYFKTGDIGYLDHENYLYLTGRAKNMIVTEGGKNVYPEEIENGFQLYEEIEQIMVRGYQQDPHQKVERIEALVYPNPELFQDQLQGGQRGRMAVEKRVNEIVAEVNREAAPYQRISRVQVLDQPMEMTTTRKIKRHAVQDEGRQDQTALS
ncbi:MAG: long-chain fatty acid--CoA ligase [Spirochaetaceae bacterium]|nr:MAG: long-chain fatty acid--CoA ligase [Spirochaetaceae bacterium]